MNSDEILRFVDQIHLERKIDKENVFVGIEQALIVGARKREGGDDSVVDVHIDRQTGEISAYRDNVPLSPNEIAARIGAQTAKQVIIQKIRDAERDAVYDMYAPRIGELITGEVRRNVLFKSPQGDRRGESGEGRRNDVSLTLVALPDVEAKLPRSERIPGEKYRVGSDLQAVIVDVKKVNARVEVILSRSRPIMVQRLYERVIPEISEGLVEIKGISREAGRRSKIAVTSSDPRIDLVGACVGIRGARSRNVTDELNGERVDIVQWSEDPVEFIRNALKPAVVDEVILCSMLGRAIVLVQRDQRSLAIGRGGQNVRLASRLCNWDVDVMTREELDDLVAKAMEDFSYINGVSRDLADQLVGEGFLSYDDLSIIELENLMEMGGITEQEALAITDEAERMAEEAEARRKEESARVKEEGAFGGESNSPDDD